MDFMMSGPTLAGLPAAILGQHSLYNGGNRNREARNGK